MSAFHIREATQDDALQMAKVRVDTWRNTYRGIVPDDFLERLSYESTAERWKEVFWGKRSLGTAIFVAENAYRDVVGIAVCGPEQTADPCYHGEIYVLYVLPQNQNQGIGRGLVTACVQHLVHQLKVKTMLIWVVAKNPYRRFYESLGGKMVRERDKAIGGRPIREVAYGWEELEQLQSQPGIGFR